MTLKLPTLDPCPFCEYLEGTDPCAFVTRGSAVSSFLNRTQYERGAVLVVPNRHWESMIDAGESLVADLYREVHRVAVALMAVLRPVGMNVFQNNGVVAGQTVPHLHVHVVPRYPDSEPGRRFREAEFEHTPLDELETLAEKLRAGVT